MSSKQSPKRVRRAKQRQNKNLSQSQKEIDSDRPPTIHVQSQADFDHYLEDPQPVMVDFWAPWCGPCQAMSPVYEKVALEFKDQVRFLKVNTEEVPELAAAFGIRSIPTVIVLDGDEVVGSNVGLTSAVTLTKMAQKALDRSQGVTLSGRLKRLFRGGQDTLDETTQSSA